MLSRHFLGWDRPLAAAVCDYLVGGSGEPVPDLGGVLLVVPTRQAGRRLREALARHRGGKGVLDARVVTPAWFLLPDTKPAGLAGPETVLAVWARTVLDADPAEYEHLFPVRGADGDFAIALRHGEAVENLRNELLDGGLSIAEVLEVGGDALREEGRWRELSRLEEEYLRTMSALRLGDPVSFKREWVADPELDGGIERIVVAGTPDPQPLALRALTRLADRLPVEVLVYAPPARAGAFDPWGRPLPEAWEDAPVDVPDERRNIRLAGSLEDQADIVAELLREEAWRAAPDDVAVGVPDRDVAPFLEDRLGREGLKVFDPAGRPLASHTVCRFLGAFRGLIEQESYRALGTLLREADLLDALGRDTRVDAGRVLAELDELQNLCLPEALSDVEKALRRRSAGGDGVRAFGNLRGAVGYVEKIRRDFLSAGFAEGVRAVLKRVYGGRGIDPLAAADREFLDVANRIDEALRDQEEGGLLSLGLGTGERFALLMKVLEGRSLEAADRRSGIDLDGWLELPWNDAPFMIVTGFNEGTVPQAPPGSPFLNESLRKVLGLAGEAGRAARDAYLTTSLVEARRAGGRLCLIAGKRGRGGNPRQPSRLLFRCPDALLVTRAERLFGPPEAARPALASTVSLALDPLGPLGGTLEGHLPASLRVTQFGDYLRCPFRFFLRHVLGMQHVDDGKRELDALDFGALLHHCLQGLGDAPWRASQDEAGLRAMLRKRCDTWAAERLGMDPPLVVEAQLAAAKERLAAAAREHARWAGEGWEIIDTEREVEIAVGGMTVRGRVDRIDRHRKTGAVRVLDYKTSDLSRDPEKVHLAPLREGGGGCEAPGGRARRWADLQLPLYRAVLEKETGGKPEIGYFCLPKGAEETGVRMWEGFDGELMASALRCAEFVARRIGEGVFWPPAGPGWQDEFGELFCVTPERSFDFSRVSGAEGSR